MRLGQLLFVLLLVEFLLQGGCAGLPPAGSLPEGPGAGLTGLTLPSQEYLTFGKIELVAVIKVICFRDVFLRYMDEKVKGLCCIVQLLAVFCE